MNRLDATKVFFHTERLMELKKTGDTFPVHMTLGVTDFCNHSCIFCNTEFATSDKNRKNVIDKERLLAFLKEAHEYGLQAVTICGSGEPLIYPEIIPLLYGLKEIGIEIGIFTNAFKLDYEVRRAILDTCTFVRCSINASNKEEHEIVHRVKNQFETIVDNVSALVAEKRERNQLFPTIGVQFVFYEDNYRSIERTAEMWSRVGVDYCEIKPLIEGEGSAVGKTVFPAKDTEEVLQLMKKAKKYETKNYDVYTKIEQYRNTLSEEPREYAKCLGQAITMNMWSDGNVYICSNQEHDKDVIGNMYEQSFSEIWLGDARRKRIEQIVVNKCPRGCKCDAINSLLWDYVQADNTNHINFI